jgi:hypothetical protein
MQAELRKLATRLREKAKEHETNKLVKCAQVLQAAIALEHIRRKIGR